MSQWVMSKPQQRSVFPSIPAMDSTEKPTHGELDDWTTAIFCKDRRTDNWLLKVSGHK